MQGFTLCLLALMSSGMLVAAETRHTIELLVVLDQSGYKTWIGLDKTEDRLTKELMATLRDVTDSYSSLEDYGMYIDVRVKQIVYEKNNDISGGSATSVDAGQALQRFEKYLKGRYTYDHATLIIGKSIGRGVVGYSWVGAMCQQNSVSVIRAAGTYVEAAIWAHEMGHSLGANHDDGQPGCEESIMTAVTWAKNKFRGKFSRCSYNEINAKLASYKCLIGTKLNENTSPRLGQVISQDELCRRNTATKTSTAMTNYYGTKPKQCLEIFCSSGSSYRVYHQTDGAACGTGKICLLSNCVNTTSTYADEPRDCPVLSDNIDLDDEPIFGGQ